MNPITKYIIVGLVSLVAIVWALEKLGLDKETSGTLGFIGTGLILLYNLLNDRRSDNGGGTSYREPRTTMPGQTWHIDQEQGGSKKCNTCQSRIGDYKAVFDSQGDAEKFAIERGYTGQSAYQCNANPEIWHLSSS